MRQESKLILTSMTLLIAIGVVIVFSSTLMRRDTAEISLVAITRHLIWIGIGVAAFLTMDGIGVRRLQRWHWHIAYGIIGLLILVLIPGIGHSVGGARRWIRFFGYGFQPSEVVKIGLLLFTAASISQHQKTLDDLRGSLMPILGVVGACCFLVLIEPDVGTAMFLGGLSLSLFLISGVKLRKFMPFIAVLAAVILFVAIVKFDHVQRRLEAWSNPTADLQGKGYQIHQSRIAFGSGGLFGEGLGAGTQKLFYLPARSTDFILAILGEEVGFAGVALVIGLFIAFIFGGMKICERCSDLYTCLLACGITLMIGMQALANIAVVTGTVPTKGISLPFVSFGGSNLVISMAAVGLLYNISKELTDKVKGENEKGKKETAYA